MTGKLMKQTLKNKKYNVYNTIWWMALLLQAFLLEDFWEQLVKVSESGHFWPHEDNKCSVG
jgi:hypothetical protein